MRRLEDYTYLLVVSVGIDCYSVPFLAADEAAPTMRDSRLKTAREAAVSFVGFDKVCETINVPFP